MVAHKTAAAERRTRQGSQPAGIVARERRTLTAAESGAREREGGIDLDQQDAGSEPVMTLHEVAQFLRCHESTVYRLTKRGQIPGFRLGSEWRFLRAKIEQWIANCHHGALGRS